MLSQVIQNVESAAQKAASIQNLPAEATAVQQQIESLVNTDLKQIEAMRTSVLAFANEGLGAINSLKSTLQSGGTLDQNSPAIVTFKANAQAAQTTTDNGANLVTSMRDTIAKAMQTLSGVEQDLKGQLVAANSKKATDMAAVKALEKKMKLLPLLILAGAAGAIALGVEMSKAKKQLSNTTAQISQLSGQSADLQAAISSLNVMMQDFLTLTTSVQGLKNAMDAMSGDLANALNDANLAKKDLALALLTATETELHEVQSDAE